MCESTLNIKILSIIEIMVYTVSHDGKRMFSNCVGESPCDVREHAETTPYLCSRGIRYSDHGGRHFTTARTQTHVHRSGKNSGVAVSECSGCGDPHGSDRGSDNQDQDCSGRDLGAVAANDVVGNGG